MRGWEYRWLSALGMVSSIVVTLARRTVFAYVPTAFAFTHKLQTTHFSDVADNCMYWHFVALAWLPIHALLYWVPRLLQ